MSSDLKRGREDKGTASVDDEGWGKRARRRMDGGAAVDPAPDATLVLSDEAEVRCPPGAAAPAPPPPLV